MRHIAIIGSGPAGYYTAEAATKKWGEDVRVDIIDQLPVPYGLIRSGVAPDHQSIKGVSRRYEKTALSDNVRFVGNITIGQDISIPQLQEMYHAVVLATGAPQDRTLNLPGQDLGNVFGSAGFVGWYNGHPQFADLDPDLSGKHAVVIGMGNVALDVARILAKSQDEFAGSDIVNHALERLAGSNIEKITILGRRGPHQIMMTPKELGELGHLERAAPFVDTADLPALDEDALLEPGLRKSVTLVRDFAEKSAQGSGAGNAETPAPEQPNAEQPAPEPPNSEQPNSEQPNSEQPDSEQPISDKPIEIAFDFFASPVELLGDKALKEVQIERTKLENGRAVGTGETYTIPADLLVACIGYRTSPIEGVPYDDRAGRFANDAGRILPGLYCVGWARRGPSGTIGTNRPDGVGMIEVIAQDLGDGILPNQAKQGRTALDAYAAERALNIVTFQDWKKIEQAEEAAARSGAPREKFVDIEAMMQASH